VEYSTLIDQNGKLKAENVTGPMGAYVQGAQKQQRMFNDEPGFGRSSGGRGGPYGGSSAN
jgi:hypothetical protein